MQSGFPVSVHSNSFLGVVVVAAVIVVGGDEEDDGDKNGDD